MTSRLTLPIAALAAVAAGLAAGWWLDRNAASTVPVVATVIEPPRAVAAFTLTGDDGQRLDRASLEGRWTLVFLGFTHCPDICPTTLATVARGVANLDRDARPQVLLVSVDPARDTPEKLAEYVRFFDPAFRAATGTPEALEKFAASLGGVFARVPLPDGGYTVDHTAALFLLDPQVRMAAVFTTPHDADALAADLRRILAGHGGAG